MSAPKPALAAQDFGAALDAELAALASVETLGAPRAGSPRITDGSVSVAYGILPRIPAGGPR